MYHKKLFFVLLAMSAIINNIYCAQNDADNSRSIRLAQGLDTIIPKILIVLDYKQRQKMHNVLGAVKTNEQAAFGELLSMDIDTIQEGTEEKIAVFHPTIIKIKKNNILEDLGSLSYCLTKHEAAREAIRQKKAAFYPYEQGAIIYFSDTEYIDIVEIKRQEINEMIKQNMPKTYALQLFDTFSGLSYR